MKPLELTRGTAMRVGTLYRYKPVATGTFEARCLRQHIHDVLTAPPANPADAAIVPAWK